LLASQFNLSVASIRQIASSACSEPAVGAATLHDCVWAACLASTRPRLNTLAQRVNAKSSYTTADTPHSRTPKSINPRTVQPSYLKSRYRECRGAFNIDTLPEVSAAARSRSTLLLI
jgi:hypothetical protein